MSRPGSLSLVLPCFNEEETLPATLCGVEAWSRLQQAETELIAVDDGSSDGTRRVLRHFAERVMPMTVLHHGTNCGYASAITRGCDRARMELIAFMDSDGQFRVQDLELLRPQLSRFDLVAGRRLTRRDPWFRSFNAWLYAQLLRAVLGLRVNDINCGMKIFRRAIWPTLRPRCASGALFNAELFLRARGAGISWTQQGVPHYPRSAGAPSGARPQVVLIMFRELVALRREYRRELHHAGSGRQ